MVEMADALLPVFPFRINWRGGLAETLEWKTDVLADFLGNEQRRGLRLTPRRAFEATVTLWDQERQFWDLWLHRMAGSDFLLPLWHDSVRASKSAAQGQTTVWVDTRRLEFVKGSYALLRGNTALSTERVEIAEVYDDRIVTVAALAATWPKGTRLEPLARGRMTDTADVKEITSRASETQCRFELTRAQPYPVVVDTRDQYLGMAVMTEAPNRSADLSKGYQWAFNESDTGTGRRYRRSDTGRAMVQQRHAWLLRGKSAKADFRSFLYRHLGALVPFWLPTFNEDITLSRPVTAGATSFYAKAFGFGYTGKATSGREHICMWLRNGTRLYRKVTGTAASGSMAEERLTVDNPFPAALSLKDVWRISWMDVGRFQNDRMELSHVNAAEGASTVQAIFTTFRNDRVAPAILSLPIPAAAMNNARCGEDAPAEDFCAILPVDWQVAVQLTWDEPPNAGFFPGIYSVFNPEFSGVFPNGGYLNRGAPINRSNLSQSTGRFVVVDVPGGFDLVDVGLRPLTIMTFRLLNLTPVGTPRGYEWRFHYPIIENRSLSFSHQFQRGAFNTGNDYPAVIRAYTPERTLATVATVVYRSFPSGYGISF